MVAKLNPGNHPPDGLYASLSGEGRPEVLLLHGLFGMGSNLGVLARELASAHRVHQLDLLNHGRSPWRDAIGLGDLADAVHGYLENTVAGRVVLIGHSLGGKVAMQLALDHPERVMALVVADIAPVTYGASHQAVFRAISAVEDARPASRGDAAALMRAHLEEEGVVQFLLLSLHRGEDRAYHWRFNAAGLKGSYAALLEAPTPAIYPGPTCFISGGNSSYIDAAGAAAARQYFPAAEMVTIPDAGHWLHAEKPAEFNAVVRRFLAAVAAEGDDS